ncbi:MAG TPA: CBS domain-containing protein [Streptosporangiaceae bacterium]|jgi:CBS domain-containing protein
MRISEILRNKGKFVATIGPEATVRELLALLAEHNIGAVVVSEDDGATIGGIVSERDVVRRLHDRGDAVLDATVASIMTTDVRTCGVDDSSDDLRPVMIDYRIRHLPVVNENRLVGIVSIGDVVKAAISELEAEREHLVSYIEG